MSIVPDRVVTTYGTVVGAALVALRFRVELRQRDLAAIAGVSMMSWSRVERGERDLLLEQLAAVALALHMPIDFVLNVAEEVVRRLEHRDVEVLRLRQHLTPAIAATSRVLGVADLDADVQRVMAKEKYDQEFLKRAFRCLLAPDASEKRTPVAEALPHGARIGRKVRPKALRSKRG